MPEPSGMSTSGTTPSTSQAILPALARLPGHLLWRAAARVTQALDDVLPEGVDIHAYAVLLALAADEALSQQTLAHRVGVSPTTMVRVAADLTTRGLVVRVRNSEDRRSYALTRTSAGARTATVWRRHAEALQARLTAGFTRVEAHQLSDLLRRLAKEDLADETPEALRESIGFLISRIHFAMHRQFVPALEPLGIEPRHFGVLTALAATGPVAQNELARVMGVSGASMVQIIDDLEATGLVERQRAENDRRRHLLSVTAKGAGVRRRAEVVAKEQHATLLAGFDQQDTDRLIDLLGRFVSTA